MPIARSMPIARAPREAAPRVTTTPSPPRTSNPTTAVPPGHGGATPRPGESAVARPPGHTGTAAPAGAPTQAVPAGGTAQASTTGTGATSIVDDLATAWVARRAGTSPARRRSGRRRAVWVACAAGMVLVVGAGWDPISAGRWTDHEPVDVTSVVASPLSADAVRDHLYQRLPVPTWRPEPPADAAVPFDGELIRQGDKRLIFRGDDGERARVTLLRVGDPEPDRDPAFPDVPQIDPSSGDRMIAVEAQVENIGLVRLRTDIEEHVWLFDDQGGEYGYDPSRTGSPAAGLPELPPERPGPERSSSR
ncbi:hypothetical protein [Actinoplanes sp. CA-252034]|uniref:hypothetical protein n=1 Tax=Actinoplanes sp. CA-252034 TaxID=3239906 RepID=UPI003D965AD7